MSQDLDPAALVARLDDLHADPSEALVALAPHEIRPARSPAEQAP